MATKLRRAAIACATLFFSLSFSLSAGAESASMTRDALRSMEQAQQQRAQICSRLRANPHCSGAENLLKQATGLTTVTCAANLRAQKCDSLYQRFPEYRSQAMSCNPNEICKLGLEATLAEGCKRYGIEVKDGFLNMLASAGACATQWQCFAETSFSAALAIMSPTQFAARKGSELATSTLQSFKDDRAKLERVSCLNPETQAQLYCYLGVKYGSMALGVSGAARAASAGLMGRMAALERNLVATEVREAPKVTAAAPLARSATAETKALQDYIRANAQHDLDFDLEIIDGKGTFSINHLGLDDRRLLSLLDRAVRSGGISKINAGRIDGPKVLNLLTRLEDVVPKNAAMRVEGVMSPAALDKEALGQIVRSRAGKIPAEAKAYRWSEADVSNYQQARRTLRIDEACDRLYVGECGRMRFSMDARNPSQIVWTRDVPRGR